MSISSVGSASILQAYQVTPQKSGGQTVQQAQPQQAQGPSEESKESAAMQSKEASQGGESTESKSINTYA
jgi:hypothetical protein